MLFDGVENDAKSGEIFFNSGEVLLGKAATKSEQFTAYSSVIYMQGVRQLAPSSSEGWT